MTAAQGPRLVINPRPNRHDELHGAWWPRSTRIEPELTQIMGSLNARFPNVLGVTLNGDEWPATEIHLRPARIGTVRLSWYGLAQSHLAVLHCSGARRFTLLLLPPETREDVAVTATLLASAPGNQLTAEQTMAKARAQLRSDQNPMPAFTSRADRA